ALLIWRSVKVPSVEGYSTAPRNDPVGKYGRCGSSINVAPAGTLIEPAPNGQMPAMARNSVDLPEPDGPVISVRSPLRKLNCSALTSGVPFGSRSANPLRSIAPPPAASTT